MKHSQQPTLFDASSPLTVSELTDQVKGVLERGFSHGVHVVGEVSNLAKPSSGHFYLKLKDGRSQLSAVIYRGVALRMRFDLTDGMEVIARGRLNVYAPRGEYQLQVEQIEPKGIGALELAFRQLKERLSALGYFRPERKRKLPPFPQRIALLTSATGAAVRDVLEILRRRWPALEVWVCSVPVQGDGAAARIAAAIERVNRIDARIDALIVGRGGGSLEDLWPFNEEPVAHAIYKSRIPVVSGVGHETDLTIADMVADVRALTPSEAAERVTPDRREMLEIVAGCGLRMHGALTQRLGVFRSRLDDLSSRRCLRYPLEQVRLQEQRIDELVHRLQRAAGARVRAAQQRLAALGAQVESLSPLKVLQRGYSLTRNADDQSIVRSHAQVGVGESIVTHLPDGQVVSRVEETRGGQEKLGG